MTKSRIFVSVLIHIIYSLKTKKMRRRTKSFKIFGMPIFAALAVLAIGIFIPESMKTKVKGMVPFLNK